MTEIQPFVFPATGQPVRTAILDDEPWFIATDVCSALEHTNTTVALDMVDDEDKRTLRRSEALNFGYPIADLRIQSVNIVNESGLYSLILRSNVPGAKAFKRWVTREVLPAIRRTGSYSLPGADAPVNGGQAVVNALAELAHRQHVVPMAGRVLAYELDPLGIDGALVDVRALPARDAAR